MRCIEAMRSSEKEHCLGTLSLWNLYTECWRIVGKQLIIEHTCKHLQTSSNISMQQQMTKCHYGQQRRWDDLLKYFLCNRWNVHFHKVSLTLLNTKIDMTLNVLSSLNFLCTCLQCLCPWIIFERWKGISVLFSQLCNTPREPMIELSSLAAQGWLRPANESHTSAKLQDAKTWNLAELRNIKHYVIA